MPDALTTIVSLGDGFSGKSDNAKKEAVRKAVGNGVKQLRDAGAKRVAVDASFDPHATCKPTLLICLDKPSSNRTFFGSAAVAATLGLYKFTTLRTKEDDKNPSVAVQPLQDSPVATGMLGWDTGVVYAEAQNFAREVRILHMILAVY